MESAQHLWVTCAIAQSACFSLCTSPLVLSLNTTEKSLPQPLHNILMDRMPPSRLFLWLNSPRTLSFSLCSKCYKPSSILVKLCWPCISMCFLSWEVQHWAQHSRYVSSGLSREAMLAVLTDKLDMSQQPVLTAQKGKSLLCKADFQLDLSLYWCTGLFLPRDRTQHFDFLNLVNKTPVCQFFQFIKIPLNGSTTLSSVPPADHIPFFFFPPTYYLKLIPMEF